jgi:hypothetical protein
MKEHEIAQDVEEVEEVEVRGVPHPSRVVSGRVGILTSYRK